MAIGMEGSAMRRLTELPEPEGEPKRNYNVRTSTPWGIAQTTTYVTPGIVRYSTASHGGYHISAGLLREMPEYMQTADVYANGREGWFEEDAAWSLVVLAFPRFFKLQTRLDALETVRHYYPKVYEEFCKPV